MLLPVRTAVLNHLYKVGRANVEEIMTALEDDYGQEKQFTKKLYIDHVMALEANGLLELENYDLSEKEELQLHYKITEDGKNTVVKYVDKKYRVA
ncbi:hypothetical protein [Loigolactobacillus zhaoyuanensis]|uniref:Uncharacterized protein n=1 Tax=Loigolactobacillus zhaoyuanensis TaxID=2486017 RepID=A0ABW8UBN6_9LACO|nr:hypothetical protein [Loigolactobacillus zhaoyuanensis]